MQSKSNVITGQDEKVFALYLLGPKTWVGLKGQRLLLPKLESNGYMLPAFILRELGFGRVFTANELTRVNNGRQIGKAYIDLQAATEIMKTHQQPLLTKSPFVKY